MFLFSRWNVVIAWALVFTNAAENPNRQIVLFDDFRKGTLPKSNRLETFLASSKLKCALRCLKNLECSSFTFCENKSCQLNSIDAFEDRVQLIPDAGCHYNGLREGSKRHRYQVFLTGDIGAQTTPMPGNSLLVGKVNNSIQPFFGELSHLKIKLVFKRN